MNNVLLHFLVTLAVTLFAIIVISIINAVTKSMKNKYEYRIKKVTVGTKDKYYIQKHFLFFWYTCEALLCESGYKEFFDTLEEAKKYIEIQKEKTYKKIEYFYY